MNLFKWLSNDDNEQSNIEKKVTYCMKNGQVISTITFDWEKSLRLDFNVHKKLTLIPEDSSKMIVINTGEISSMSFEDIDETNKI